MNDFAPHTVLHNGRIITVDETFTVAEAVAIYDGKVVKVGTDAEVLSLAGSSTSVADLRNRCVIPGQVDAYAHFIYSGIDLLGNRGKLNITTLRSVREIVSAIRARAAVTPRGDWIGTSCMHRGVLKEGRWPTRKDLDSAASENPVYIMQGGRPIIANSRALELAGISRDTPDPTNPGGRIVRDADGEPTGQLIGGAADMARTAWGKQIGVPPEHWDFAILEEKALVDAIMAQQKVFHSCGVTAIRDSGTTRLEVEALIAARDLGALRTRTGMAITLPLGFLGDAERRQLFDSYFAPWPLGGDFLWIWGVTVTYNLEGWPVLDLGELRRCISEAAWRGWAMAITPSIGGDAGYVASVLDLLEGLDRSDIVADRRWALFHPEALRDGNEVERARRLGLAVNPNPLLNYFAAARSLEMYAQVKATGLHQGIENDPFAQTRSMWGMSVRRWLDAGLVVSAGSNTPAVVYDPEHPLLGQYCILTGDTTAGTLLPDQAVDREDMVRIYTSNGAKALGREDQLGSIEVGKFADLVVLDRDVLTCDTRDVANAKVLETYVAGELVYQR